MLKPGARLTILALRDLLLALLMAALWQQALQVPAEGLGLGLHGLTALFTVLLAVLLHEWGHLAAAALWHSRVMLPATPWQSLFLFRFDVARNSRAQFIAMSLGGFAASLLMLLALLIALPRETLAGQLSLGLVLIGVAATFIFEVPILWRVWRGAPLPSGPAYVGAPLPQRR